MNESIGSGKLLEDGTIELKLRATDKGYKGTAELRYPPTNEHYAEVRQHLEAAHGELKVGQAFSVPPFPD